MRRGELANAAEAYIRGTVMAGAPLEAAAALESGELLAPIIAKARERFLGVGAAQYQISETEQSFERSTVGTMLVGKIEEQVDDLNYSTMLDILIERRLAALHNAYGREARLVVEALNDLRDDLRDSARLAATSAALMNRHIERLVALGEYERRGEADYASQLAAECDAAGAPMRGSLGAAIAEEYGRQADELLGLTPETPAGLDAILDEFEANEELVGVPAREYRAGLAYIRELEHCAKDNGVDLSDVRSEVAGDFDENALAQWFDDGGGD